jgi:hypothetical protein
LINNSSYFNLLNEYQELFISLLRIFKVGT